MMLKGSGNKQWLQGGAAKKKKSQEEAGVAGNQLFFAKSSEVVNSYILVNFSNGSPRGHIGLCPSAFTIQEGEEQGVRHGGISLLHKRSGLSKFSIRWSTFSPKFTKVESVEDWLSKRMQGGGGNKQWLQGGAAKEEEVARGSCYCTRSVVVG
ncbi:Hypothetical predicted protein [Prunus dulcis]|uniref:Uncharacterized protein n=1 Tax=Prunus dulcis TaxID=3755 RepID=A0A5E4FAH1_PRUDU|nr:Hypothetical predicted protein [Prunus dulcis]